MAIDTNNKKLSLMEWDLDYEPGIPLSETAPFSTAVKQQLLWGYAGIEWMAGANTVYAVWQNNRLEIWIKGVEVIRIKPDGDVDFTGAVNAEAF